MSESKIKIAIFASGAGSNAARIIEAAQQGETSNYEVVLIACNKPDAGVWKIAAQHSIATLLIEKEPFFRGDAYVPALQAAGVEFIVLAGFLWKIPSQLIAAYPTGIVNIHPALLPDYGGKGMYGHKVHEAVIANAETESGITIHWVDEQYDHGSIIFQALCPVEPADTPDILAQRIHVLEHKHYPKVVDEVTGDLTMGDSWREHLN